MGKAAISYPPAERFSTVETLLRVDAAAGHGHGKPTGQVVAEASDCLAFIDAPPPG